MKFWIVIYTHGHGTDAWPVFQKERPSEDEVKDQINEEVGVPFDNDREYLDMTGPWTTPAAS